MDILSYTLTRKAVKNINLRVRPDGSIAVSAPPGAPRRVIDDFVKSRREWIEKAQKRTSNRPLPPWAQEVFGEGITLSILGEPYILHIVPGKKARVDFEPHAVVLHTPSPQDTEKCRRQLKSGWEKRCLEVFALIVAAQEKKIFQKVPPYTLRVRDMKSRWGTCAMKKGVVTLSSRLLQYPESCIAYVALHELVHFFHPDHGPGFHHALESLWPGWRQEKKRLGMAPVNV